MARPKMVWIAMVAALLLSAAPADAKRTLKLSGTERGAMIATQGPTTTYAALGSDQRGSYAASNRTTVGAGANGAVTFTSVFLDYYVRGTERGTLTGTATPGPNGTVMLTGTGKITGGTGRYRHARGTLTFSGTQDADGRYVVTFTGTLRY